MSAMNSVCPNTVTSAASVPTTYITSTGTGGRPMMDLTSTLFPTAAGAYSPSTLANPTYTITNADGTTVSNTAYLFSVLDGLVLPVVSGRYTPPTSGYWSATNSQTLTALNQIQAIYTSFTTTNVPTKSTKIINPNAVLQASVTGQTAQATTAVSYDLLYSLQYEFCFWVKVYSSLLGDYVTVQNTPTNATTFTDVMKTDTIKPIINLLNAVNLRLTDLTEIANYIAQQQSAALGTMNTQVNQFLSNINSNTQTLITNGRELSGADANSNLRKRMLEFSEEKNNYANQLLTMYGAANFIALGLLFYIYKS